MLMHGVSTLPPSRRNTMSRVPRHFTSDSIVDRDACRGMFTINKQHQPCAETWIMRANSYVRATNNTDVFEGFTGARAVVLPCDTRAQTSSRFSKMTSLIMGAATTTPDLTTVKARRLGVR